MTALGKQNREKWVYFILRLLLSFY